MSLMDFFRRDQKNSAAIAKERLRVLVAHDRLRNNGPDYLPQLQRDILEVIRKYVEIGDDDVVVNLENQGQTSILELNVTLPDQKP
ncbi:cell division topological specificity factor MinE [Parathalassolituus penaei]|uniref:Cell division topological specificity factor n=1 Tax=Parathalassolituus penaei TaxID=2997323 RepID=A0A9X3IRV3_9GAMM|nr:cell division topological specificity factor MinE [Parathalassolituus penaei]MCY0964224.1 cell division topological specificity factor MinE [Parathalassolituus penaei]